MRYLESSAFERQLRALRDRRRLAAVREAVLRLVDSLEEGGKPPAGLGLKMLRPPFWEIRSSLQDRIVFAWEGREVVFAAVGTHDEIKRFLRAL
ncbi:MAG: hypothetical protein KGL53_10900 [Elusimicrobia bacterium]|nr:hypothetical protein [Elusimicrobiota bacterium]